MKLLLFTIVFFLLNFLVQAQSDSTNFDRRYQALFDTTQTKEMFLENINSFARSMESMNRDSTRKWHQGQTDYHETFLADSLQTFNSTTYFNSMTSTLFVNQLVYNGKVICKESSGGTRMYNAQQIRVVDLDYLPPVPVNDSIINPDADKKEQVAVPKQSITAPSSKHSYYNHELGIKVTFTGMQAQSRIFMNAALGLPEGYTQQFTSISSLVYQPLGETDKPYVFIENH